MPRQSEYDIQGTLESYVSRVESKVERVESKVDVQGVESHAGSDPLSTVDSAVGEIPTTDLSAAVEAVESKIEVQGVASHAGSLPLSSVSSKVDQVGKGARGTTFFKDVSAVVESLLADSWVTIYESGAMDSFTEVKALKITNAGAPAGFGYRLYNGSAKLFPYGESKAYTSGDEVVLAQTVNVEKGESLLVQVFASVVDGGSATLDSLKLIQMD